MNKLVVLAVAALMGTTAAHATEVLSFGQSTAGSSPITATVSGGVTTIMATDAPVSVTSCLMCSTIIGAETLTIDATSVGKAFSFNGFVIQNYTGTFEIMSASGQNILSGTFTDATFGAGTSLTLSASNAMAGEKLNLTSNVIPLGKASSSMEAASLSFADVQPLVSVSNGTLAPFTASVAGTFSAQPTSVPEPGAASIMLLGLAGIGYTAWRRRKK